MKTQAPNQFPFNWAEFHQWLKSVPKPVKYTPPIPDPIVRPSNGV